MTTEKLKELLDACFTAKRITETMMDLPHGMKPRHIHVIDAIYGLGKNGSPVRVSDVSKKLNITTPSVTKLINDLLDMGVVTKSEDSGDKRFTLLGLTEKGLQYEKKYVTDYHLLWTGNCDITDAQAETAINVIMQLQNSMPKGGSPHE